MSLSGRGARLESAGGHFLLAKVAEKSRICTITLLSYLKYLPNLKMIQESNSVQFEQASGSNGGANSSGCILLVDDDPIVLESIHLSLIVNHYQVSAHSNAATARQFFDEYGDTIDLVLCDLNMPGEDGVSLLTYVLGQNETVVGMLLTGEATTGNAVRAMRAGVYDFISKPLDMGTLEAAVKRALRHRHLLLENLNYQRHMEHLVEERGAELAQTLKQLEGSFQFTLQAMVSMLEAREKAIGEHSKRVTWIAVMLAEALGVEGQELEDIRCGAFLHDIGKVAIPDAILQKPSGLDEEEWKIMKTHAKTGYDILSNNKEMQNVAAIVYSHHERYDGSGYPRGLKGEAIPRGARVFAVADAYDAIRFDRPYSPARSADEVLREIVRCRGSHFDPEVVDVLPGCQPAIEKRWSEELMELEVELPQMMKRGPRG